MNLKTFLIAALHIGGLATAQDLLAVLHTIHEARELYNYLKNDKDLQNFLGGIKNATVLAPVNDAFKGLIHNATNRADEDRKALVGAVTNYHVLDGVLPQKNINDIPKFVHTKLQNASYEKVPGGQVVKVYKPKGQDKPLFTSALNNVTKLVRGDIKFDGGLIHLIDQVMPIPQSITASLRLANLSDALGAIQKTNLGGLIDKTPGVTFFAGRNQSFEKIGSVVQDILQKNKQSKQKGTYKANDDELRNIIQYSIGRGVYYSTHLDNLTIPSLLNDGKNLALTLRNGQGFVNSARLVSTDLLTNNGVIHVIDQILNPNNATARPPPPHISHGQPMFSNASSSKQHEKLAQGVPQPNKPIPLPSATPILREIDRRNHTIPGNGTTGGNGTAPGNATSSSSPTSTHPSTTSQSSTPTHSHTHAPKQTSNVGVALPEPSTLSLVAVFGLAAALL